VGLFRPGVARTVLGVTVVKSTLLSALPCIVVTFGRSSSLAPPSLQYKNEHYGNVKLRRGGYYKSHAISCGILYDAMVDKVYVQSLVKHL